MFYHLNPWSKKWGPLQILLEAMRELENRQTEIAAELKAVQVPEIPQAEVESYLADWRRMLRGSMMQGRQVIQKIVRGRILMIPLKDGAGLRIQGGHTLRQAVVLRHGDSGAWISRE